MRTIIRRAAAITAGIVAITLAVPANSVATVAELPT
jgi:hypothetical protein